MHSILHKSMQFQYWVRRKNSFFLLLRSRFFLQQHKYCHDWIENNIKKYTMVNTKHAILLVLLQLLIERPKNGIDTQVKRLKIEYRYIFIMIFQHSILLEFAMQKISQIKVAVATCRFNWKKNIKGRFDLAEKMQHYFQ